MRYSMVVDDGVVKSLVEPNPVEADKASAAELLKAL